MGKSSLTLLVGILLLSTFISGCIDNRHLSKDEVKDQAARVKADWIKDETAYVKAIEQPSGWEKVRLNSFFTSNLAESLTLRIQNLEAENIYGIGNAHFSVLKVQVIGKKARVVGCDTGNDVYINTVTDSVLPGPSGANPYAPTLIKDVLIDEQGYWKVSQQESEVENC